MVSQDLSWVGLEVGDFNIDQNLGGGMFSSVFAGNHARNGLRKAFKVAKAQDLVTKPGRDDCLGTRAIAQITGSTMNVIPDTSKLLKLQHAQLCAASQPAWIKVEGLVDQSVLTYYAMEFLEGETVRQKCAREALTIPEAVAIARCLDLVCRKASAPSSSTPSLTTSAPTAATPTAASPTVPSPNNYHGDIKPENIFITKYGITLIDPGYFGRLDLANGSSLPDCAVTTAAYYPTLEPDDLLAFGLMLFELVLGVHPTARTGDSQTSDLSKVGPNLLETVRLQEMVGKYFLSGLLNVPLPSSLRPDISSKLEQLLLKIIRLRLTSSGKLELEPGFQRFSQIADALSELPNNASD